MIDCIAQQLLPADESVKLWAQGRDAAVLMAFRPQQDGTPTLVFTKRRDDLPSHPGQISFPGGSWERDDTSLIETALREAEEEIAVPRGAVNVIGGLEPMPTVVSDFAVYPIAGTVDPQVELRANPGEVDSIFEVDLATLVALREQRELQRAGMSFTTEAFDTEHGLIWGVTGYILGRLLDRIGDCVPGA